LPVHALFLGLVFLGELAGIDDLHAERVISNPPEPATMETDMARPSASDRLADRGVQVLTVGSGADCDHNDLSAALAAASDGATILLERTSDLYEGDTYTLQNRSMTIRGGYDDCLDLTPSGRTVLDAAGSSRVFDLYLPPNESGPMDIVLENLTIRGGSAGSLGGGGLLVEGRQGGLQVELINVEITDNASDIQNGGGIRVEVNDNRIGFEPMLTMDNDSAIIGNSTGGNGGGLACDNPDGRPLVGTLIRLGAIDVSDNSAVNGGGLALSNCGTVFIYGGGPFFLIVPTGAIFGNTATGNGGGLFVEGETQVRILGSALSSDFGDPDNAAHIVSNQAERGGGVYASGNEAEVVLEDTVINSNEATQDGGGIYAGDFARVEQRRDPDTLACEPSDTGGGLATVPRCSRMVLNTAISGAGGGYFANTGAQIEIRRTIISENGSEEAGSVARATSDSLDDPGSVFVSDSLIHGNTGRFLFYGFQRSFMEIRWSTITDNELGAGSDSVIRVFSSGEAVARADVVSSIIWEDSGNVLTLGGNEDNTANGDCVIGHQDVGDTDFTNVTFYANLNPILQTVDDNLYYPANDSPAIDFCDGFNAAANQVDINGFMRGNDWPGPTPPTPPNNGVYDVGAYEVEYQPMGDAIFQDRFQSGVD